MYNIGIGVASAPGAIIENNVIINESSAGITAIAAPDRTRGAEDMAMITCLLKQLECIYCRLQQMIKQGSATMGSWWFFSCMEFV